MNEQKAEKIADCNTENTQNSSHPQRHDQPQQPFLNRIIESTEQIINNQAITIFKLSNQVKLLKKENQVLNAKYEALLRNCGNDNMIKLDQVILKIGILEDELVQAKMDLALCKAENLEIKFKGMKSQKNIVVQSIQAIKYPEIEKLRGHILMQTKSSKVEENSNIEEWNRLTENLLLGYPRIKKFKQKSYDLIKKGIPSSLRQSLWPLIFQNRLGITPNLYSELFTKKQKDETYTKRVVSQINKDICRSFNGKTQFDSKVGLSAEVTEILQVFHIFRPDISYVQGMTYPVIVLNLIVGKYRAFGIFCNLILGNQFFRRLYAFQENYLSCYCRAFDILLEEKQPKLAKFLSEKSIHSEIFLVEWFYTFFSRGLSYQFTLKIWDYLAYQQQLLFYKLALAIFQLLQSTLLDPSLQQPITIIRQFSNHLSEHKLQQSLFAQKLNLQKLQKIYDKMLKKQRQKNG